MDTCQHTHNQKLTQDVVSLCAKKYLRSERCRCEKSPSIKAVAYHLNRNNLIETLSTLWEINNDKLQLDWLRQNENEMQAPLLFERGLMEFKCDPNEDTLYKKTLPLYIFGAFRVWSDERCLSQDPVAYQQLKSIYESALSCLVESHLDYDGNIFLEEKVNLHHLKEKMETFLRQSLTKDLPSPVWIAENQKYNSEESIVELQAQWEKTREVLAYTVLENVMTLNHFSAIDTLF